MDVGRPIEKRTKELKATPRILALDIGNTAPKAYLMEGEVCLTAKAGYEDVIDWVNDLITEGNLTGAAYCCVGDDSNAIIQLLHKADIPMVEVGGQETRLPIEVDYDSPATLGADRIAAAIGAVTREESALVVDAGTALTCDVMVHGQFRGGNIAPGMRLRFEALHQYTSRLPLVEPHGDLPRFGYDTFTAIRAGVVGGILAEIASAFRNALDMDNKMKLILTGGDADFIASNLKVDGLTVTVDHYAVARGLVRIFNYNL